MTSKLPLLLLSGFMGSGKTTVGRALAEREGVPFLDLDDAVEQAAGRSIAELFAEGGEALFRSLESRVFFEALDRPAPCVIALGGGTLLDPKSRRAALERARVVTLTARASTIEARTAGSPRPLLAGASDRSARIRELLSARADAYAEVHALIATDRGELPEVLDQVRRAWMDQGLLVPLGSRSYPVRITDSAADAVADAVTVLDPSGLFIVTDEHVSRLWGTRFADALQARHVKLRATVVLPAGEPNKRLSVVEDALSAMIRAGADRGALVVAHGGGVVSDMAGFAAATLFRGVRWLVVPTTLLAMVDAAIGGKTGVDLGSAKNAVGAFHQPSSVIIDPAHVATETDRAFRSGLAEVVKSACVGDASLFDLLESAPDSVLSREASLVRELILRAARVKVSIVSRDERESGDRALLNFGHTLGHALEAQGGFERLTHGEAVSLGMVAMLRVGRELGVAAPETATRVTRLLDRLGLPVDLERQPVGESLGLLALDKKRVASSLRVVLLRSIGEPVLRTLALDELSSALARAGSGV